MPAQTDATLQLVRTANAGFGTVRFEPRAASSAYKENLAILDNQLPSIYFGAGGTDDTTRLRPLHEQGFVSTQRTTRLYFAVAGLIGRIDNPNSALTTDLTQVGGPVYESKYYVFVKLGVGMADFQTTLGQMRLAATAISTADLRDLNLNASGDGETCLYYVNAGNLEGTYWAFKKDGWKQSFVPEAINKRLFPLGLMDFRISAANIATARKTGDQYGDSLAVVPTDDTRVHFGHTMMDPVALAAWYGRQNFVSHGGLVVGSDLWSKYDLLGQYLQRSSYAASNYSVVGPVIQGGSEYYPRECFHYFPTYTHGPDPAVLAAHQSRAIVTMINGFVDS